MYDALQIYNYAVNGKLSFGARVCAIKITQHASCPLQECPLKEPKTAL
jgi:hypothetical protein